MSGAGIPGEEQLQTLAQKITWLLHNAFPSDGSPADGVPSDRQVVRAVNERAGRHVIGHTTFWKLRTGKINPETGTACTASEDMLEGIAAFFDVDPRFFKSRNEVVGQVVESLRFLRSVHNGDITGIAGRGLGEEGLSHELMAFMNDVLAESRQHDGPSGAGSRGAHAGETHRGGAGEVGPDAPG
ncbi:hypothetical protein N566_05980 [Streptomycetaceae bacterium MP113-05]|nr:hypothetical protein N566_05980 [Streptomycetaceae bacterium MP113-05]